MVGFLAGLQFLGWISTVFVAWTVWLLGWLDFSFLVGFQFPGWTSTLFVAWTSTVTVIGLLGFLVGWTSGWTDASA